VNEPDQQLDLDQELDLEQTDFDTWIRNLPGPRDEPADEEAA
jgi:hypothetical protein